MHFRQLLNEKSEQIDLKKLDFELKKISNTVKKEFKDLVISFADASPYEYNTGEYKLYMKDMFNIIKKEINGYLKSKELN